MSALDEIQNLQRLEVDVIRYSRPTVVGREASQRRLALVVTGDADSELSEAELVSIAQLAIAGRLLQVRLERRATFRSRVHSYLLRRNKDEVPA